MKKNCLLITMFFNLFVLNSFANDIVIKNTSSDLKEEPATNTTVLVNYSWCVLVGDNLTLTANPTLGTAPYANFSWTTTSTNGFTSTLQNPTVTATAALSDAGDYTVTYTDALLNTFSNTITVSVSNTLTTPAFDNTLNSFCQNGTPPVLSKLSTNGIRGTWSPAIVDLSTVGTSNYTFTPNPGQCASVLVFPITVKSNANPFFAPIPDICQNDTPPVLPTTSDNGIVGTWFPANVITSVDGVYNYTFTPTPVQCALPTDMVITVLPSTVVFNPPIPAICAGDPSPLPPVSSNGITGTWSPAFDNMNTGTYTFTPDPAQCAMVPADVTVIVNPIIVVTDFTPVGPICFGDVLAPLPTTSSNGVIGTWAPAINNTSTTTYNFTPNAGQCATPPNPLTIVVNNTIPVFAPVLPICSGDPLAPLPTTSTNGIIGTWAPALNNTTTTTYTFTPNAGQCSSPTSMTIVVNQLTAVFTPIPPICLGDVPPLLPGTSVNGITGTWSPAVIDSNILGNTDYTFTPDLGQCSSADVIMTITVNQIIPTFTQIPAICEGSVAPILPLTSDNGYTGTWIPASINSAVPGTVSYQFTPNVVPGTCLFNPPPMLITVNPITITGDFNPIAPICSGDASPLPTTSINGVTGVWSPAFNNTTDGITYTFTPNNPLQCATTPPTVTITVTPSITPIFSFITAICEGDVPPALPGTSDNAIVGTWSPAAIDNMAVGNTPYIFTATPIPGQCFLPTTVIFTVNATSAAFNPIPDVCQGEAYTLPTISSNGVNGTWAPAFDNQAIGTTSYTFTPDPMQCATLSILVPVTVIASVIPDFSSFPNAPRCESEPQPILPGTSDNAITGTWSTAIITSIDSNTDNYAYTFNPTSTSAPGCAVSTILNSIVYKSPTEISTTTTNVTNDKADGVIEITGVTSGLSPYQYSFDGGPLSTNTTYTGLVPGDYTIAVTDANGCTFSTIVTVSSICIFPNAISPNNDSLNDTFKLNGCSVSNLKLFNRYGKEVNNYNEYAGQWDGKNEKGEELPDGTYFYVAEMNDGTSKSGWVYISR